MSLCLQSIVDEILRIKQGKPVKRVGNPNQCLFYVSVITVYYKIGKQFLPVMCYQSTDQPTHPPTHPTTNQQMNEPTSEPPINQSINQSTHQSINQSINVIKVYDLQSFIVN